MTTKYILTHTPREIANKHSLEEIQSEIVYSVVGEFDDSNALVGGFSWEKLADDIPDLTYCQNAINEWFDEREPKDRPTAKSLACAYQLYCAVYLAEQRILGMDDKTINYNGTDYELSAVLYSHRRGDTAYREGVLLHDTNDIRCEHDTLYYAHRLDDIKDAADVEKMLSSQYKTTDFRCPNLDGYYTIY